jgi:hypothetical protein
MTMTENDRVGKGRTHAADPLSYMSPEQVREFIEQTQPIFATVSDEAARGRIARVLAQHWQQRDGACAEDAYPWPCRTVVILTGADE